MTDERRISPRHSAYIGAEIDTGDGPVKAAITHDGSATGILLLTRADLDVGQTVKLSVFFVEGESKTMTGKVVRRDQLNHEENTLWRSKVAVALDEPHPDLAQAFTDLAEQQAKIYGTKE
ncbi:MAG: PilZ domain-containing protein [Polyangiaceae bacterium]|nr:PilZ domain-containing protein [Polyangiaceae bacterium]MBK8998447.1 PilZ domain-containing protein [Myxococcales bacterium]MCE7894446.1 PilZ domain-containing protein [Sorangiineae bacterium PRO1]MCL4752502.1 PilZ domain-containing protein [Myxococcales bacterium]